MVADVGQKNARVQGNPKHNCRSWSLQSCIQVCIRCGGEAGGKAGPAIGRAWLAYPHARLTRWTGSTESFETTSPPARLGRRRIAMSVPWVCHTLSRPQLQESASTGCDCSSRRASIFTWTSSACTTSTAIASGFLVAVISGPALSGEQVT